MKRLKRARELASDIFLFFCSRDLTGVLDIKEQRTLRKYTGELLDILDELRVRKKTRKRLKIEQRRQRIANEIIEMEQSLAMYKSDVGIKIDKIFSEIHNIAEDVIKTKGDKNEDKKDGGKI